MLTLDYFKKTFHFSPEANIPFYAQLASYIRVQIQAGVFKPGDQMLTETDLCTILNVSRTTIRQSMNQLVEDGLLIRYRGRGSFIAEKKLRRNINYMYNFTENIRDAGAVPSSIVLDAKIMTATETVAERLQLPEQNTQVFFLRRLRCANSEPLILESTYIPHFLCPGIEQFDFSSVSLYTTLSNSFSLNLNHAVETIEAIIVDNELAEQLHCSQKLMPGYRIERISYLFNEVIFEYTTSITRADKCEFRLDLYKNSGNQRNKVDFERRLNP